MALKPAQLVTPWDFIRREYSARGWGEPFTAGLGIDGVHRAQWGTMTMDECSTMAKQFGTSVELWVNLNKTAAEWLADHGETDGWSDEAGAIKEMQAMGERHP
jgi:hypothetical protein